ncbi:uncharacterized protein LOC132677163 isoform X2 [Panthera onca]
MRQCSSSISGTMENCNTHLPLGFTLNNLAPAPANVAAFQGLLGPGGFNSLYEMSFQQWNHFSPCGLRTSWTPLCSWGFTFPTRAPPGFHQDTTLHLDARSPQSFCFDTFLMIGPGLCVFGEMPKRVRESILLPRGEMLFPLK